MSGLWNMAVDVWPCLSFKNLVPRVLILMVIRVAIGRVCAEWGCA